MSSTATMTPQATAIQPLFNPVSYTEPQLEPPQTSQSSHPSSPESRPVDPRSPIPEEEEEDETGSETANEPLTPTDSHHPHSFHDKANGKMNHDAGEKLGPVLSRPPLIFNTSATPPATAGTTPLSTLAVEQETPKTPITPQTPTQKRPPIASRDSGIKRAVSGLFRRSNSHLTQPSVQALTASDQSALVNGNASDLVLGKERRLSTRRMSANTSPYTTRSNTPPSPGSSADHELYRPTTNIHAQEPAGDEFFHSRTKNRSATGFSIRDKLQRHKITFAPPEKEQSRDQGRHRATSVDLEGPSLEMANATNPRVKQISRQVWGLAAETGIGLKSRRMSLSLPDDFTVDVVELYSEYADQSRLVGRRGKTVGKGATANVKLMIKKGGSAGEVYAVKEFRGKSSQENADDYEKKVKSEYSIAKSVRHPNIVETFRLCTHNGRWNHVMEFCDQGDLFSLVSQKYLAKEDHLVDRLCLFKQLIQGLNYLHNNGIAHRDVKLENLLITKDSKLKITDFGVSEVFAGIHPGVRAASGQCGKEMGEIRLCTPGMCGSPPYVAPEVVAKRSEYDPRPVDVWGAAIVMLCMCANGCLWDTAKAGSSPLYDDLVRGWTKWNTKHSDGTAAAITESDYPYVAFFDNHIKPPALRRMLLTMLNPDPFKRVTMAEVAKNRWLKHVECCQVDSYDDPTVTIDVSKSHSSLKSMAKVVHHNHLPPATHMGHKLVRLPGSTDM